MPFPPRFDHAEVAAVACAAFDAGEPAVDAVAEHFRIDRCTAQSAINSARRNHDIPDLRTVTAPYRRQPAGDWTDAAACLGLDPDLFFPERGEDVAPAKAVCAGCPVREDCLDYALDNGERHGIWGGLSERERRRIRRDRRAA